MMANSILDLLMKNVETVMEEEHALKSHMKNADKNVEVNALTGLFKGIMAPDKS